MGGWVSFLEKQGKKVDEWIEETVPLRWVGGSVGGWVGG